MATGVEPIHVEGLRELQAGLRAFAPEVRREFSKGMRAAVEPARRAIESRMGSEISHMKSGSPWVGARAGVSLNAVYIVPQQRSTRGPLRRPNFAQLAMQRAYVPSQAEAVPGLLAAAEVAVAKAARGVSV